MSDAIQRTIQERWQQRSLPQVNGVLRASGAVTLLHRPAAIDQPPTPGEATSLAAILERYDPWIETTLLASRIADGLRAYVGDGEMGNEGAVVLCDDADNLLWAAVLDFSNPFYEVELADGQLIARDTHERLWRFPLAEPERVSVTV